MLPDIDFEVAGVESVPDPANPAVSFRVQITNRTSQQAIHGILLRCQVQIEAARRRYTSQEQDGLRDLFGEPKRWSQTLRPVLWANVTHNVPSFTGSIVNSFLLSCAPDFTAASSKYFQALETGDVPLTFLFRGSVFYDSGQMGVQVVPLPWSKEARFRFPVQVWHRAMNLVEVP